MGAGGGEARSKHRAPAARGKNRSSLLFLRLDRQLYYGSFCFALAAITKTKRMEYICFKVEWGRLSQADNSYYLV